MLKQKIASLCVSVMMSAIVFTHHANATPVNQAAILGATTVEAAKNAKDDSLVTLRGNIVRALDDERYEFRDQTGTIVVEIDHELWQGRALQTNQTVTIIGETDVDFDYIPFLRTVEVDVHQIRF